MKILSVILVFLLVSLNAYGAVVPTKVSGNTVTYSTVSQATFTTVTFDSVTKHIIMWNESHHADCYVDLYCTDADGKTGFIRKTNAVVKLPQVGEITPNVIAFDFATRNLGFICEEDSGLPNTQRVTYIVTGELGDL